MVFAHNRNLELVFTLQAFEPENERDLDTLESEGGKGGWMNAFTPAHELEYERNKGKVNDMPQEIDFADLRSTAENECSASK